MLGRRHAQPQEPVTAAWDLFVERKARCVEMGYTEPVAAKVALSDWDLDELESRIADYLARKVPARWARELAW